MMCANNNVIYNIHLSDRALTDLLIVCNPSYELKYLLCNWISLIIDRHF